jgi:hypothetical protein
MKIIKTVLVAIVVALSAIAFHIIIFARLPFLLLIGTVKMWVAILASEMTLLYSHIREMWRVNYQKV